MKIVDRTNTERRYLLEVSEEEAADILYALRKTVPRIVNGRPRNLPVRAMRDRLSQLIERTVAA